MNRADAEARAERFAVESEPIDREYAEDGPALDPEERARSDAFWAGAWDIKPLGGAA